jgi:hypothetical protein
VQDIVMRVAQFPAPGSKISGSDFLIAGGGCAANAALAVASLGGRAGFAGPLGEPGDAVSSLIVADLESVGIDCRGVVRVPGATASVSVILIDATAEESIATRRGYDGGGHLGRRRRVPWRVRACAGGDGRSCGGASLPRWLRSSARASAWRCDPRPGGCRGAAGVGGCPLEIRRFFYIIAR